jgi:hypothetical protein
MNRFAVLSLAVVVLFVTTHRLPAPIVEESAPTPTPPKIKATTKAKARTESEKPQQTKKTQSMSPMAGTWHGAFNTTASDGGTGIQDFLITISQDGKNVRTQFTKTDGSWSPVFLASTREGSGTLISWTFPAQGQGSNMVSRSFIFQLNGNRTATLSYHALVTGGELGGATIDGQGSLTKQ